MTEIMKTSDLSQNFNEITPCPDTDGNHRLHKGSKKPVAVGFFLCPVML